MEQLSIEYLLQHKTLDKLSAALVAELEEVQKLNVSEFTEAEVRHSIIDPVVSVLGYRKGDAFSLNLERKVSIVGKHLFPDYRLTLWNDDFWLIEAKRPKTKRAGFNDDEVRQAVEYAAHPDINAALVVLCDGYKFEIFDREEKLDAPIVRVEVKNLVRDFDQMRALLAPWQAWFFQKRRVVRLVDKVFAKEFNEGRLEEFRSLILRRLDSKRAAIVDNLRAQTAQLNDAQTIDLLGSADAATIVNVWFPLQFSQAETAAMLERLAAHCEPDTFRVLHRLFPDEVRDANHIYWPHALAFLMTLAAKRSSVTWLPAWLASQGPEIPLTEAIERLMTLCLTHFHADPGRKAVLLAYSAWRRIFKAMGIVDEGRWKIAEIAHVIERMTAPELSMRQIFSSPSRQLLIGLVGSINSDHIFSGNSDHIVAPGGARGRTPATPTSGGGKDDRHAQAARDSGVAPGGAHAERSGQIKRRLAKQRAARRS